MPPTEDSMNAKRLYLDLMKKTLTRALFQADTITPVNPEADSRPIQRTVKRQLASYLGGRGIQMVERQKYDHEKRMNGLDWPADAETMVGLKRLDNLQHCLETVIAENVPGDFIETGVWRGGASIFARAILAAHEVKDRTVWVADSFEGLPAPDLDRYPDDHEAKWHLSKELAVSIEQVRANFQRYGLLDERVKFLKGWFKDTLPNAPIAKLAVIRLDGDMYQSTMDALNALFPKLSTGGFVIIDDYGIPEDTCRKAIHDFREQHGITEEIHDIDGTGAYWRHKSVAKAAS